MPRRTAVGFDYNRVNMLLAILEKRFGLDFGIYDAYVNVVGGMKVNEPAADLAVAAALVSAIATGLCLRVSSSLARLVLQARCAASARPSAGLWMALIWASANSLYRTASCSCHLSRHRLCVSKHWSRRLRPCSVKDNIYRLVRYKKRRLVDSLRFLVYTVGKSSYTG